MPELQGLVISALGPADQILRLTLDPEMRRVIGHVGQDRHQWHLPGITCSRSPGTSRD